MVFSLRLDEKTMTKRVLTERVSCNLCSSSKYEVILREKDRLHCVDDVTYEVVKCAECGLVYTNPRPRFTEMSAYYPEEYHAHRKYLLGPFRNKITSLERLKSTIKEIVLRDCYDYSNDNSSYFSKNHPQNISYFLNAKFIRKLIAIVFRNRAWQRQFVITAIPHFRKNGRLLDTGCGSGQYLYWMKQFGWDVAGVEISSVASEGANDLALNVFCGQLSDAHFPDRYFDVVTMWQAIEHLHDPKSVLDEVNRILKDDGLLLMGMPNIDSFEFFIFKHNWPALEIPRHLYQFSPSTITMLLTRTGFGVEKILFPVVPGGINWILDYLFEDLKGARTRFRSMLVQFFVAHARLARLLWFPFCYFAAKLGYGGGMTVYAKKMR